MSQTHQPAWTDRGPSDIPSADHTALQSTTGYRLTRETPEQRQEDDITKAADAAAQAKQRQGAAKGSRLRGRDAARLYWPS